MRVGRCGRGHCTNPRGSPQVFTPPVMTGRTPEPYCRRVNIPISPRAVQTSECPDLELFVMCTSERRTCHPHRLPSQQDHRLRHYQLVNAAPHPLSTECRRRAIGSPRTPPQTTSSARGDDRPSLRRPWSSLATPRGATTRSNWTACTSQVVRRRASNEPCAPATPLPTHQLRRRTHLGTSLLPH